MYTSVVVLVEILEFVAWAREENDTIVSRISYNQNLANSITINFYPVTYDQYLRVLGLPVPNHILALGDCIESKQVSFI